jgi:hypothetical protein
LKELPRVHLILDAGRYGGARLASARAGGKIRGSRIYRDGDVSETQRDYELGTPPPGMRFSPRASTTTRPPGHFAPAATAQRLDHMAFSAKDLPGTVATLKREGIEYALRRLPGGGIWQLFFNDPHGAKVEFDFDKNEPAPEGHVGA